MCFDFDNGPLFLFVLLCCFCSRLLSQLSPVIDANDAIRQRLPVTACQNGILLGLKPDTGRFTRLLYYLT